jgi:hypothetical protein
MIKAKLERLDMIERFPDQNERVQRLLSESEKLEWEKWEWVEEGIWVEFERIERDVFLLKGVEKWIGDNRWE